MKEQANTKEKLVKAGIKLFSRYGYAATSTRMLASEAGVNLSAIAFHYTSKECLFQACLDYLVEKIREYYSPVREEIEKTFEEGKMDPEKAWNYLERLVDLQMEAAFGKKYQTTLAMVYREESSPDSAHVLTDAVFHQQEEVMARLIQEISSLSKGRARVVSRFINGSIIAFGEHKGLIVPYLEDSREEEKNPDWIREEIRNSCLAIIRELKNC